MSVQYISDSEGIPTGVYIPLEEWNKLKSKYKNIEVELNDIPEWHKAELDRRFIDYKSNPKDVLDFDEAIDDIDKEL
ncbi:addiction module protein [Aquimarina sp. ERC-38]|uniref:addiction module protein n=1 Tax=Aquimarina sp. ERC-38 TaxID=2949996 RepID=UPI002247299F|nr:addiction module protein [Aquimarina sp. ERC-38]UZO82458.1 addiction module protein [Aquimarina sp. ERC-38]